MASLKYQMLLSIGFCLLHPQEGNASLIKRETVGVGGETICNTETCQNITVRVTSSMDNNVDPCEDFYQFACGGWMENNPIPETKSYIDTWAKLRGVVSSEIQSLIEQPITAQDIDAVRKVKTIYTACMDEDELARRGSDPIQFVFENVGPWPLLEGEWDDDNFDLINLLLKARRYNRKYLIFADVNTDLMDGTARIVRIDQPGLGMSRDRFLGDQSSITIPAFRKMAYDVAVALGAVEGETLDKDIDDLVQFAKDVANITVPGSERRYISQVYNKMTLAEMKTNISDKFDWLRYIQGILGVPEVNIQIDENEPAMVLSPKYLTRLMGLLEITPKRTVANYVMWLMIKGVASHLTTDFRLMSLELSKTIYGVTTLSHRKDKCVPMVNPLSDVVSRMFIETFFDDPSIAIIKEMVTFLRNTFNDMLVDVDWMDDETRIRAKEKADLMDEKIGYADEIKDDQYLNKKYKELSVDPRTYFENTLITWKFVSVQHLKRLRIPIDKLRWTTKTTDVNCYYNSINNQIIFPAGILQPPFFNKNYPKSMNFGGIGMLIGHEITHGFDDRGRQFDKDGKYVEWWTDDVVTNFGTKKQCIIDQYSEYYVSEANMTLDGVKTQGENIADNGALRQAYTAYHKWKDTAADPDFVLPNLDYNGEQLFFLNFAQIWCQSLRPEAARNRILTGVHAPGRFRVNGPLTNFKAFSEAFKCSPSNAMNANHTCRVW